MKSLFSKPALTIKMPYSVTNYNPNKFVCQLNLKSKEDLNPYLRNNLTKAQIRVFYTLVKYKNKYRNIIADYRAIARDSGCVRATAQSAVKRLIELGLLAKERTGFNKPLRYHIHHLVLDNLKSIASFVRGTFLLCMLLSPKIGPKEKIGTYIKNNVVINLEYPNVHIHPEEEGRDLMLQFTDEQYEKIKRYPKWVYEKSLEIFKRKKAEGSIKTTNEAAYFFSIFVQQSTKRHHDNSFISDTVKEFSSNTYPKTETRKPYVRPNDGPYSIAKPPEKLPTETDFEAYVTFKMRALKEPERLKNSFFSDQLLRNWDKLTPEEQEALKMVNMAP
jgi:DNA-binding MarR family transcriptional regulator